MTTPLVMLGTLLVPLLIVWRLRRFGLQVGLATGGVAGLVMVFLFTASGHFLSTQAMAEMLPPFVPARVPLVYLTGLLEIALALGLALPLRAALQASPLLPSSSCSSRPTSTLRSLRSRWAATRGDPSIS
jgi:hypothetical protein